MQRNDLLVWVDLEMTSLQDVLKDRITEIAVILTDPDLNVVAEGPDIVIQTDRALFDGIPDEVKEIHHKSGIVEATQKSSVTLEEAEQQVLAFLKEHVAPNSSPLCGNSIHMDRHFLRIQMPELDSYLHYRCIDVSTLKGLAQRWRPDVYEKWESSRGEKAHRAKDDILRSIEELKFYRENFLKI